MKNYFEFDKLGTNFRTEFIAGLTTFLAMAYILFVNPHTLSATGMDQGALLQQRLWLQQSVLSLWESWQNIRSH